MSTPDYPVIVILTNITKLCVKLLKLKYIYIMPSYLWLILKWF